MGVKLNRREFVKSGMAASFAAAASPTVLVPSAVKPVVISDLTGIRFKNGGPMCCVEKAFDLLTRGEPVIDAVIAGVNIPENDPEENGVGYGGTPNAEGVVQLDSCCMDGPTKRAGGVAALEGVRTPSLVAKAVMETTDHHLLVGKGAQDFARHMGFDHRRRPQYGEVAPALARVEAPCRPPSTISTPKSASQEGYRAGLSMVADGLLSEAHFYGTINCDAINSKGEICGRDDDERPLVQDSRVARAIRPSSGPGSTSTATWAPRARRGAARPISTISARSSSSRRCGGEPTRRTRGWRRCGGSRRTRSKRGS